MNDAERRLLTLAPAGGDAALTQQILARAGVETTLCDSVEMICREAEVGVGAVLLPEEALVPTAMDCLLAMLRRQPPWSDLPIMVLLREETAPSLPADAWELLGNVVLLERPPRELMLANAVRAALRGRGRQYEYRDHLWEHTALVADRASLLRELDAAVQVRDQFLSIAAHELRTPLTSLLGYTTMLQRGFAGVEVPAAAQRALRTIAGQATRLTTLIEQLLDVGRIQRGQFMLTAQPLDLGVLAAGIVEDFRALVAPRLVTFTQGSGPVVVRGDVLRLEQVLQNLLGNAAKYSPAEGPVDVRLDRDAAEAILEVEDAGPGIPAAAQQHLFEHYRSGAPGSPVSGLGVGLYIVHEIVTRHGGRIEVESADGRGSIFRIRLPLLLPPPVAGADAPHPEPLLATPLS